MGVRFNKRIKILPYVTMNVGKSGMSLTIGPKGKTLNIGSSGVSVNVSMGPDVKKPAGALPGMVVYTDYATLAAEADEALAEKLKA